MAPDVEFRTVDAAGDDALDDDSGRYVGRQDQDGRHYDESGRYRGRTDADGRHYDASGRYDGRSDD